MYSPKIKKLISLFSKFPSVGPKTAARFVFYLLELPDEKITEILEAIKDLKKTEKICPLCFKYFEPDNSNGELCQICSNRGRDRSIICVVEKQIDLEAIENPKIYKGLYFILGGTISSFSKKEKTIIEERAKKLIARIKNGKEIKEVILALNPTPEGRRTAIWLKGKLKNLGIKITQLGTGLPIGGEVEYADEETLKNSFEGRK